MPNTMPIDTRPSSPIQRLSNAYFRKNAVAKRIITTAIQPTQRRPIVDSRSKALSVRVGGGAAGGGSGAIGGGAGVTGSGRSGGGSGPGSRLGRTTIVRAARAASRWAILLLVLIEITRATIGSTIAESNAASRSNT